MGSFLYFMYFVLKFLLESAGIFFRLCLYSRFVFIKFFFHNLSWYGKILAFQACLLRLKCIFYIFPCRIGFPFGKFLF